MAPLHFVLPSRVCRSGDATRPTESRIVWRDHVDIDVIDVAR
jgi:hypothetical protein